MTVTIKDDDADFMKIKGTNAVVALEKLVTGKNLKAFEIAGQKIELEGKKDSEIKQLILLLPYSTIKATDGSIDTLSDFKGNEFDVKVYLEKDGVKAEDTYKVIFK